MFSSFCLLISFLQVQDIVVGNKNFTESNKPSEIVQLLLTPDQLANLDNGTTSTVKRNGKKPAGQTNVPEGPVRDLWNEEGDDFFGFVGCEGVFKDKFGKDEFIR